MIMVHLDEHGHFGNGCARLKTGSNIIGSLIRQGDPAFKDIES